MPCFLAISAGPFQSKKGFASCTSPCINLNTACLPPGSNVKPVGEEAAESAATTAPTQSQALRPGAAEVNGFLSPSEETRPAPQSAAPGTAAAPPCTRPTEAAKETQGPPERPTSLPAGPRPQEGTVPSRDVAPPCPELEPQCQPPPSSSFHANGFSESTDTSVLSPSSLADTDLLEAALDDTSSSAPGKQTSEAIASVNVEIRESSSHRADDGSAAAPQGGSGETGDKPARRPSDGDKKEGGEARRQLIVVKTQVQEGVVHKRVDAKSGERVEGCDEPDGLQTEDLPSVSEDVPSSQTPEPKKKKSLLRRSKKKSHQGKVTTFSPDPAWDVSLLVCAAGGKMFYFLIPFCILFMGYFGVCT